MRSRPLSVRYAATASKRSMVPSYASCKQLSRAADAVFLFGNFTTTRSCMRVASRCGVGADDPFDLHGLFQRERRILDRTAVPTEVLGYCLRIEGVPEQKK